MAPLAPERALVIMAHPDEVEYFVGGTVTLWTDAGADVTCLILTNGDKGSHDPEMTPERLVATRRAEQHAAAHILGIQHVVFFDEPDGDLAPSSELRKRIVAEIRRHRPEAVILPDPGGYFHHPTDSHPDLRPAGEVALGATLLAAGNPRFHPELLAQGLEPHVVSHIWMASPAEPNHWVDITAAMDRKVAALCCHRTQVRDPEALNLRLRARNQAVDEFGRTVYREAFRYVPVE